MKCLHEQVHNHFHINPFECVRILCIFFSPQILLHATVMKYSAGMEHVFPYLGNATGKMIVATIQMRILVVSHPVRDIRLFQVWRGLV